MSLYDPPHLDTAIYAPCTCGLRDPLRHDSSCAKIDEHHPARERARETAQRQRRWWFGPNDERGRR